MQWDSFNNNISKQNESRTTYRRINLIITFKLNFKNANGRGSFFLKPTIVYQRKIWKPIKQFSHGLFDLEKILYLCITNWLWTFLILGLIIVLTQLISLVFTSTRFTVQITVTAVLILLYCGLFFFSTAVFILLFKLLISF
jgi:hypothetical protein